jgi:hypothetical protein
MPFILQINILWFLVKIKKREGRKKECMGA